MPPVIGPIVAAVTAAATYVGAAVGGFVATVTGSIALGGYVSTALFYGTQLAIYAGLSMALQRPLPKPETGMISIRQSVPPRRRAFGRVRISGPLALWEARDDFAYQVIALHAGRIEGFVEFYLNDDRITIFPTIEPGIIVINGDTVQGGPDGRYPPPQVKIQTRLGLATETAYADLVAGMPGFWTTAHRGDGVASMFISCQNGKAVHQYRNFPNGEPQGSAVLDAQWCYDPRDDDQDPSDPDTWAWSDNAIVCLLTYRMYERGYAYDWSADEVGTFNAAKWARRFENTIDYWIQAANDCDDAVPLDAGGTEPRYRVGGYYELDQDESSIVSTILNSADGWHAHDGRGGEIVYAGKYRAPSVTLTSAHIKGADIQYGVEAENDVNQVVAIYSEPTKDYNSAEADPWNDDDAIDEAGRPRPERLDLPWVQSHTQARRLAKRRMARHRAVCRGTLTVSLSAQAIFGQRYLRVQYPTPPALNDLVIEVTGSIQINLSRLEAIIPFISVDPDTIDQWTPADEEGAAPPPVDPSGAEALDPPTIDSATAWYVDGGAGGNPRLILGVTGPDREDLTWQSQWRVDGLDDWAPFETYDDITDHPSATLRTGFVTAADSIEVQVRYQTGGGLASDWSASAFVDTATPGPTADSATIRADSTLYTADAAP